MLIRLLRCLGSGLSCLAMSTLLAVVRKRGATALRVASLSWSTDLYLRVDRGGRPFCDPFHQLSLLGQLDSWHSKSSQALDTWARACNWGTWQDLCSLDQLTTSKWPLGKAIGIGQIVFLCWLEVESNHCISSNQSFSLSLEADWR